MPTLKKTIKQFTLLNNQSRDKLTVIFTILSFVFILPTSSFAYLIPCFTPQEKCLPLILKEIDRATKKVWLQGYTLTSLPIEKALMRARDRMVDVQVILDRSQIRQRHSRAHTLRQYGIPVYIDSSKGIAHSKIIIADDTVLTGSYNWTHSAEVRNCENLLILKNEPETLKLYENNFLHRKGIAIQ
ncbi:phospholipase D precursor [Caedimonas varicaedens]|uniref:Phospholipase D n=1 Tax=Caedimonas varicaedens TaxID=1629334 RepID=A0A0K8MEU1_9PROT|nr:phospholipase D precursor [Caedimonas varicaedens]